MHNRATSPLYIYRQPQSSTLPGPRCKTTYEHLTQLRLKAIGEEGSRLAIYELPEGAVSSPRNQEDRRKTAPQVIQAAKLSIRGLLGKIAEVMEKDEPLDSARAEGICIMSSISDSDLSRRVVIPKLMTWRDNAVTLFNEFGTEGDRLRLLEKLDFNDQAQVFPIHAEDHAETLHQSLQVAGEVIWRLSKQVSNSSNSLGLEKLSTNFAASVKVEGSRILGSINDIYLALVGDGESSHCLRHKVLTQAVTDYLAWQDNVVIYLEAIGIRSSNLIIHELDAKMVWEVMKGSKLDHLHGRLHHVVDAEEMVFNYK
ncbi:hypothetical protein BDN72DRAFT_883349 [Pluteus cervinus]|uniref:Uncharacterized protein n=1 Tax=Pluteus cervinus TaxID=181527 RepID=A0ACD3A611_9AGAR|nr:hypothetical protein BDN72DRAFT_883349 [Pluteus cervinus]